MTSTHNKIIYFYSAWVTLNFSKCTNSSMHQYKKNSEMFFTKSAQWSRSRDVNMYMRLYVGILNSYFWGLERPWGLSLALRSHDQIPALIGHPPIIVQAFLNFCVRCQVSGVRCQVSGVGCQVSGVRCQVSGVRFQVSGVRCQVSGVTCD